MNLTGLKEILEAREARAARQQELLLRGGVLVSCGLNVPGPVKNAEIYRIVFEIGLHKIEMALRGIPFEEETGCSAAGPFAFLRIPPGTDGRTVKRIAVQTEEQDPLGRLWDLDVLIPGEDGPVKLSRSEIGYPKRKCLICDAPAFVCVRASRHGVPEVLRAVADRILSSAEVRRILFGKEKTGKSSGPEETWEPSGPKAPSEEEQACAAYTEAVAVEALRAILYEVITTPKPGLVDAENNGAHKDMNITTFFDSAAALAPYFLECAGTGVRLRQEDPEKMLPYLRPIGMEAEKKMYLATGGVNTHKGAVFTMGVLCAAAGWLYHSGQTENGTGPGDILRIAGRICSSMENGSRGIRTEAMNGYPSVAEAVKAFDGDAWPLNGGRQADGFPGAEYRDTAVSAAAAAADRKGVEAENAAAADRFNTAGVRALLVLMSQVDDSNAVRRKGEEAAAKLRRQAEEVLNTTGSAAELLAAAARLDQELIRENVSPGGSADLLAAVYFLKGLETSQLIGSVVQ